MDQDIEVEVPSDEEASKAEVLVQRLSADLQASLKREKDFRKDGWKFVKMYEAGEKKQNSFNILYSNTETLAPALYSSTPRPVVQRRFKDDDPLGMVAAKAGQRILEYLIDSGMEDYSSFNSLMSSAVLEGIVPGRGCTRFKYDATFQKVQNVQAAQAAEAAEGETLAHEAEEGELPQVPESVPEKVSYETVCGEEVPWDRVTFGYAKKWKELPWVCFDHFMTPEELIENFGPAAANIPCEEVSSTMDDADDERQRSDKMEGVKGCWVHEFWDKRSKTVIFFTQSFPKAPLRQVPDPLQLQGFFPMPAPFQIVTKISDMTPVALYKLYEEQAKELNDISARIVGLIRMCKVRGFYDGTMQGIEKVLGSDEGAMTPIENAAALQQGQTLDKAIWLMPIEKVVQVLQQLYLERQQCKQVIFEIIGLADIMRGSSQASETLGAQELKAQWGGLRIKRHQAEVARYCRDSLRIMLEIAVTRLSEETLKAMTGLPYPTGSEKEQMMLAVQQAQAMGQEIPPDVQELVSGPSWAEILNLLRNDLSRSYRIDIETNSTVDLEATDDKQQIAELLNAISQFLSGVSPLVEQGVMPFEIARDMLLAVVRRFRFGPELEEQLKKMQPPQPKPDPKAEADIKMKGLEIQEKEREGQRKEKEATMEMRLKEREHELKMAELNRKAELDERKHLLELEKLQAQVVAAQMMPKPQPAAGKPKGGNGAGVRA